MIYMDNIKVKNIFAAVWDKLILEPLLNILDKRSVRFWGTEGTVKYLTLKGFVAEFVVSGFDFDGRVKTLQREVFARILANRTNRKHMAQLRVIARDDNNWAPFDLVIVDLYPPDPKIFPESMDIGGQSLIRAAVKNYKNVVVAFDKKSLRDLTSHIRASQGSTLLEFRKKQAASALKFISERSLVEMNLSL